MPKGNVTPTDRSLQRLSMLDKQLKDATTPTKLQRVKTLLKAYTTGISSSAPEGDRVKALRRKIAKREESLLKNANRMSASSRQVP